MTLATKGFRKYTTAIDLKSVTTYNLFSPFIDNFITKKHALYCTYSIYYIIFANGFSSKSDIMNLKGIVSRDGG
jgi:hypothetical protein